MKYHDTHFHLDLMPNPIEVVKQIEKSKIYTIAVTNSPEVFHYTESIAKNTKYIRPALGLHPELVGERYKEIKRFIELIDRTKYIGEIGLDNSDKPLSDYKKQIEVFEKIIASCADYEDKILTVHSRRAESDLLDILGNDFPGRVILHWYSGSIKNLEKAISRGYFISVNYQMTKSIKGQKIIDCIPSNQILLESDGPFISRGNNKFTPMMVNIVLDNLCVLKKSNNDELKNIILQNFYDLIRDK
ncbi:Qat anti-phage system TatD family nuclease QatD [Psychroserpens algicola]|uniref:TatD family hydrolase n=1 Tax=Psychroserpens algicola TaxID=1719034 RepID=A0ABT0H9C6_9FLAO|nr:Qat anti-phage system TatD family nuclease QatD [Psychroserpens algicola]MCK8480980.1 TatD family hydrolase [Psychroserpens algicola]